MKKVLIAVPYHSSFRQPLINGFKVIGYNVLDIDYRFIKGNIKFNRESILLGLHGFLIIFLNIFNQESGKKYQSNVINSYILKKAIKYKPDIFFVVKGENIKNETIKKLKKNNIKTICWMVDYMFQYNVWPWFKKIGPYYDVVLQSEVGITKKVNNLRWKNKRLLMLYAADSSLKNIKTNHKIYNVVFVGTFNPEREKYLYGLKKFGLKVWGYNWKNTKLSDSYMGVLSYRNLINVYSSAKIVIANNQSQYHAFTNRLYEATTGRALVLHEHNKYIGKLLKVGEEIICFKNPSELENLVEYFLKNNKERKMRAAKLFKNIMTNHTYDKRLKMVLEQIGMN